MKPTRRSTLNIGLFDFVSILLDSSIVNTPRLTLENFSRGFLIDEELMAGIHRDPQNPGTFNAFVLRHTTGEYLGYQGYKDLNEALTALNRIPRDWKFERAGGCGGCSEGNEVCNKTGKCHQKNADEAPALVCSPESSCS